HPRSRATRLHQRSAASRHRERSQRRRRPIDGTDSPYAMLRGKGGSTCLLCDRPMVLYDDVRARLTIFLPSHPSRPSCLYRPSRPSSSARRRIVLFVVLVVLSSSVTSAQAEGPGPWGITFWGLSYHIDQSIDYAAANYGAGVRYYIARHVFVEGDVLRNSNRGLVLPVSLGVEVPAGSIGACHVAAIGAVTLAYYQNLRTESDYLKLGPVPGVSFTCGRFKPNVVVILSPSHQPIAAIAASLTILLK